MNRITVGKKSKEASIIVVNMLRRSQMDINELTNDATDVGILDLHEIQQETCR